MLMFQSVNHAIINSDGQPQTISKKPKISVQEFKCKRTKKKSQSPIQTFIHRSNVSLVGSPFSTVTLSVVCLESWQRASRNKALAYLTSTRLTAKNYSWIQFQCICLYYEPVALVNNGIFSSRLRSEEKGLAIIATSGFEGKTQLRNYSIFAFMAHIFVRNSYLPVSV